MKLATFILSLFVMNSCGSQKATQSNLSENKQNTLASQYQIVSVGNNSNIAKDLVLEFDLENNRVSGFSGCNRFTGSFKLDGFMINIGPLAATKRACMDENKGNLEQHILQDLEQTVAYSIEKNTLNLVNNKGVTVIKAISSDTAFRDSQSTTSVEYLAVTRGGFLNIILDDSKASIQQDRNKEAVMVDLSASKLSELETSLKAIDVKNLHNIEPPSKKHQYDGAMITTVSITQDGVTYTTKAFDNDNPPKELEALINVLISLTKTE